MIRRCLMLVVLALPVCAGTLDDAKTHLENGRFTEALDAAKEVPETDAAYPRARYLMGEVYLLLGDHQQAEDALRAAAKKRRKSAPILTALGRVLIAKGDYDGAVATLSDASKADPKSGRARCFLGLAKLGQSKGRKGRSEIKAGVKLAPKDPEVARAVVLAWLQADDLKRARAEARRFAKVRKDHPMGPFLHGLVLDRAKDTDDAIEAYERALKIDDTFLDAHKNLAIVCIAQNPMYTNKKRTDKAVKHFKRYFELGGKDAKVKRIYDQLMGFLGSR